MGRSRGGLTTKIHALVDAEGLPIALKLTEGQAHDGRSACDMLEALSQGQILLADRAYDADALRQSLKQRGAWANIKPMPNRRNIPAFSAFLYRQRNLVERFFNNSSISAASPRAMTSAPITFSPGSNSHRSESGAALMSR
jgi:transposase